MPVSAGRAIERILIVPLEVETIDVIFTQTADEVGASSLAEESQAA